MTSPIPGLLLKGYLLLAAACGLLQPLILIVFRLNWGWQFFVTGKGKLAHHSDIVEFFTSLGIPFPDLNAWFVGGLEATGGILLILGLLSRPIGLMLSASMCVAYLTAEKDALTGIFKDQEAFLHADPFFFLLTALLVAAFGPGVLSLDYLIGRFVFKQGKEETR